MLFIIIQFSVCEYTINLYDDSIVGKGKFLALFLEPFDAIEIKANQSTWTLISEWTYAKNLYLDITAENSQNDKIEFGPFSSSSKLIALHFRSYNYTLKLTSDSADEQIIGLIIMPNFQYDFDFKTDVPSHRMNFPFLNRYTDTIDIPQGETFIYDADNKEGIIAYILMGSLLFLFLMIWAYTDLEYIRRSTAAFCPKILQKQN